MSGAAHPFVPSPSSLLQTVQSLLERTYRMETGVEDIGRYVIGDEGYRILYGSAPTSSKPGSHGSRVLSWTAASTSVGARVLVRDGPGHVGARIYYPDSLIRSLERNPPARGIGEQNIDPFATFVEELDHFLLIAERVRLQRPVSLLELELHANVTKYLVCALYLSTSRAGGSRGALDPDSRLWLLWHLFEKIEFAEGDPEVQSRYRDASRFARRFLDILAGEPSTAARIARLRAFHDAPPQKNLAALA